MSNLGSEAVTSPEGFSPVDGNPIPSEAAADAFPVEDSLFINETPAEAPAFGDGSLLDDTFSQEDSTFAEAATSGEETLGESSVDEETSLESASFAPAPAPLMDLGLDEPTEQPAVDPPLEDPLDLDDLLTQEQGENLVAEQPPIDDSGFDLDNLEDLLKEPDNDDDDTDSLFDNLDDLSNLS
jgi:hypothetical protein